MKKVYGVGVNDAEYSVFNTRCPIYKCWEKMLGRCYSVKVQAKQPSYVGCYVHPDWLTFSTFAAWYKQRTCLGAFLDKDLLVPRNKIYGPDTCLLVSREVNNLLTARQACRGELPIGVSRHPGTPKYLAHVRESGIKRLIGCFTTVPEAAEAYLKAKAFRVTEVAVKQECPLTRKALLTAACMIAAGTFFEV